jgi:hypothetical protein
LDFNGFCDNGDTKLFSENNQAKKSPLVLNATLGGSTENLDLVYMKSPSKTNNVDLESRILCLFQIILDFVFEILTKDDLNQLESELKVQYTFLELNFIFNFFLYLKF